MRNFAHFLANIILVLKTVISYTSNTVSRCTGYFLETKERLLDADVGGQVDAQPMLD
ncbi:MAG: hypothetical protein ACM3X9_08530 [Bacillota bacterium]